MNEIAMAQREKVCRLEKALAEFPPVVFPVRDMFAPGVYLRELTLPANAVAVGAIHKTEHFSIISKGSIRVETDEGLVQFDAPHTFISKPGAKRAVYALTETIWTTVHANPTDTQDLEEIVRTLCDKELSELAGAENSLQIIYEKQQKELLK